MVEDKVSKSAQTLIIFGFILVGVVTVLTPLLPHYRLWNKRKIEEVDRNNLLQLRNAIALYEDDWDGKLPPTITGLSLYAGGTLPVSKLTGKADWFYTVEPNDWRDVGTIKMPPSIWGKLDSKGNDYSTW